MKYILLLLILLCCFLSCKENNTNPANPSQYLNRILVGPKDYKTNQRVIDMDSIPMSLYPSIEVELEKDLNGKTLSVWIENEKSDTIYCDLCKGKKGNVIDFTMLRTPADKGKYTARARLYNPDSIPIPDKKFIIYYK